MRALAIDLGREGGLVVLSDDQSGKPRVLELAAWDARQNDLEFLQLAHRIGGKHHVDFVATESIIKGWGDRYPQIARAQAGQQRLARAVSQALQVPLRTYAAATVKVAVGAKGRVRLPKGLPPNEHERLRRQVNADNKRRVQRCVQALVEGLGPGQTEHVYDAAAIGLCALSRERWLRRPRAGAAAARTPRRRKATKEGGAR